jgi:hypothetical protein
MFLLSSATLLECSALVVGINFIFQRLIMKTVAVSSVFECYKSDSRWFTNEVFKTLNKSRTGEGVAVWILN